MSKIYEKRGRRYVPVDAVPVSRFDLWVLVLSYVRYAIGRRSTAPWAASDYVQRWRPEFTPEQVEQIAREVEAELRIEETHPGHCGMECDVRTWRDLVRRLRP